MENTIVWADTPVTDRDRAREFYAAILEAEIPLMDGANGDVALLPMGQGSVGDDLARGENQRPGAGGITVYLDSKGDPEGMMERVAAAVGRRKPLSGRLRENPWVSSTTATAPPALLASGPGPLPRFRFVPLGVVSGAYLVVFLSRLCVGRSRRSSSRPSA